jgi:hypothetical protein
VRARDQRGQVGAALAARARQRREAKIGALHHRPGEAIETGGLQIDEKLCGTARREGRVGRGRERADGGTAAKYGQRCGRRHEPAQEWAGAQYGHAPIVPACAVTSLSAALVTSREVP